MKSICIKSNNKYIIDYLLKEFSNVNLDCVYLSNHNFKIYNNVIVHYTGTNIKTFYNICSSVISNCILFFYERKLTKSILSYNYFYFNDIENKQILDDCMDLFTFDEDIYNEKYDAIYEAVHSIVLSGFVNFRLQKYKEILDYHIDLCVNNFLIEKEYCEFINLLHLYVNSKESTIDIVHLVYINKESILIDDNKNIIQTRKQYV